MARSKFLQYQDVNGDGTIDVCDDLVEVEEEKCPGCIPNPYAIVPLWHKRKMYDPFLNERVCKVQITKTTKYSTTGAPEGSTPDEAKDALREIYKEYVDQIIKVLLDVNNKDTSVNSINTIKAEIEYTDWYLDFRPKSRLKLLYSVPIDVLAAIPDAELEDDELEDEDTDIDVTHYSEQLYPLLSRIRKGLHLYNRHLKVMQWESSDAFSFNFVENDVLFNLEDYGDFSSVFGDSIMGEVLPELENFLNSKGYAIPYAGGPNILKDKVYKLEFKFSAEYELKKLAIYTAACPEDPIVFIEGLSSLKSRPVWSDPTAMAYFARLQEMEVDLTAREPLDWIEFIKKYTYPEVYELTDYVYEETGLSCVGEALLNEGKKLGQDILSEAFGIGDALAYQFHKNLCMCDPEEVRAYDAEIGKIDDPENPDAKVNLKAAAIAQAFEELEQSENAFERWCAQNKGSVLGMFMDVRIAIWTLNITLDDIKLCGLLDLLTEAIECLMGGLTLEEGMGAILEAAMQAMSIQNFGALYSFLPPEDQAALDALVKQKIESGDIFISDSGMEAASDDVVGNYTLQYPWDDEEAIEREQENMVPDSYYYYTPAEYEEYTQQNRETLAPTATGSIVESLAGGETEELSSNTVMQLYVRSILELFKDRELELIDQLNKFPGAPLIANVLSAVVCPKAPMFEPSFVDFIQDFEIPFVCGRELTWPQFKGLMLGTPFWKNFIKELIDAAKEAINLALYNIIQLLVKKLCEIIADAICKALEVAGAVAVAALSPNNTIRDAVKDAICGEDVDDETVDATIAEMFAIFGVGGEAFADPEALDNFTQDISSATTRKEVSEAFLGEPSEAFLAVIEGLIEFEYPQYASALSSRQSIGAMFRNMGNLMPAQFRSDLRDLVNAAPENELVPANPSLCLTPQQVEDFCDLRTQLLQGRASPEQIQKLCDRQAAIDDIAALSNVFPLSDLPKIQSTPGCDDGLLPYEPDELAEANSEALSSQLEALKIQYSEDMLGNGPTEKNWGLMNMILSDTLGNPLTAHNRKSSNRRKYTDFNITYEPEFELDVKLKDLASLNLGGLILGPIINLISGPPTIARQRGAFPSYVAEYLQEKMAAINVEYISNNSGQEDDEFTRTFDQLDIKRYNPALIPDQGYNIDYEPDVESEQIVFTERARKRNPDLSLSFEDDAKGLKSRGKSEFSYAFDIEMYMADLIYHHPEYRGDYDGFQNKPFDNVRFKITEKFNEKTSIVDFAAAFMLMDPSKLEDLAGKNYGKQIIEEDKYEFLATDDTFAGIDISQFIEFSSCFETKTSTSPPVILLKEIINQGGGSLSNSSVEAAYNTIMSELTNKFFKAVADNSEAFKYGATYDGLTREDCEYVVDDGQTNSAGGTPYGDAKVTDPKDGDERKIRNRDMILGISAMQYRVGEEENRVFYLNPEAYGGSYRNPPLYIKPNVDKGWMGFVNAMFPELSACKPATTDIVDFGDIQEMVDAAYQTIPEDERLQQDPDCAVEAPYNRILDRSAVAGLQGLIMASIRIYASVHLVKALATFTKFAPRFPEVFSSAYAAYIVEDMEESFKDAQPDFGEAFNTFKDEEFWYSFLEQSVQMYARRVEAGEIEAPDIALRALKNLNDMQRDYEFPTKDNFKVAKDNEETDRVFFRNYKSDENLEAIRQTEEDAKLILKELVMEQLNYMGEKFMQNFEAVDMKSDIYDLDYYIMESLSQGSKLTVDQKIVPSYPNLPESGDGYYTAGNEFVVGEDRNPNDEFGVGDEYVGYYHVHTNEDNETVFMVGEYHIEESHDVLYPMAHLESITVGDVEEYPYSGWEASTTKPFVIEKYISINGVKTNPTNAVEQIKSNESTLNISDVYPGDLEIVEDEEGNVLGLTGELGVRHGLLFSMIINGRKYTITEVEIDALDLTIGEFNQVKANSKLLLCLVKHLKEDDKFKLLSRYILSLPKLTTAVAIYNDMAFLPSIGEVTVDNGDAVNLLPLVGGDFNGDKKPGRFANVSVDDGVITDVELSDKNKGWASIRDRSLLTSGGLFVREWDNWDQVLLRNSKRLIKRQFRSYYNSRDFSPAEIGGSKFGPGQVILNRLKGAMFPSPGQRILPWWRRRKLRSNPFNADGEMCEKAD